MMNFTKRILALLSLVLVFAGCKKKLDDYYKPSDNAAPSIYAQLQSQGKFTKFLSLIDKAGYKQILSSAGFWTMFAPTDSAFAADTEFQSFLTAKGISNVDATDSATAINIVQFLLVFNGFNKDKLDDYQSNTGYIPNSAFKRRTANYTGFYNDTTAAGVAVKAIASNRNFLYVVTDNNNKHIPYFTSEFLSNNGLSASLDYNYFYPNTPFSGFNVANAKVTQQDITAENGVIHIIDHVVTPMLNLEQYLRTKGEYSEFRKMLETYMASFILNPDATNKYKLLTGDNKDVYVKTYNSLLAFSPNNENHLKLQENDAQRDGWSLLAPRNDVFIDYVNRVLLENYTAVNFLPPNIIADLINSHMWRTALWPSKFNSTLNALSESPHINFATNIIERKILSNGFFYGINKVNEPNVFSSVYGKAYLNPRYSFMTQLLNIDLRSVITNVNAKYTVLMVPDAVFAALGYGYNPSTNFYTFGGGNGSAQIGLDLQRIVNTMVIPTPNGEMDGLGTVGYTGTGVIRTFAGEIIKWKGNQIISAGTEQRLLTLLVDSFKTAANGRVLFVNNLPYFSTLEIGKNIEALGTPTTSEFNLFWNYLKNSTAIDAIGAITGTLAGNFYTVFAPNNASVRAAITAGLLPGTAAVPNFTPTTAADKTKVEKFILYHIIDKSTIIDDKTSTGIFPTLLKLPNGDPATVTIQYTGGVFEIKDLFGRTARLIPALSNNLSNRTVIHLIDNYLKYP